MTTTEMQNLTVQVYQVFIKATPEQIWDAITKPEFTERYFHGVRSDFDLRPRPLPPDDGRHGSARDAGGGARGRPAGRLAHAGRPCTTPRWPWRSRAESRGRSKHGTMGPRSSRSPTTGSKELQDGRGRLRDGMDRRPLIAGRRCSRPESRSGEPTQGALALVVPRALQRPRSATPDEDSRVALGRERYATPENAGGAARACDRTSVEAKSWRPVATSTSQVVISSNVSQSITYRAIAETLHTD